MIVEAAIFLPVFIIGVLTVAYLIKIMAIQGAVFHSFADEARKKSSEALICPIDQLSEIQLKERISRENQEDIDGIDMDTIRYPSVLNGINSVVRMDLNYNVKLRLPIQFHDDFSICESLKFREFVGTEENQDPLSYEEMEREKESHLVWIFPRSGGRYHESNCRCIKSEPRQMILSPSIRKKYKPCSICHSSDLPDGSLIYCFVDSGYAYHTGNCPIVDKYVVPIEKEEAIEKGYTPCRICGGE